MRLKTGYIVPELSTFWKNFFSFTVGVLVHIEILFYSGKVVKYCKFSSYVKIKRCQNMDSCFTTISTCDVNVSSDLKPSHYVNTLENNEFTRLRKLMKGIRLRKFFPMVINTVKQWLGTADFLVEELCPRGTYFLNDHLFWHSPFTNTVLFESLISP